MGVRSRGSRPASGFAALLLLTMLLAQGCAGNRSPRSAPPTAKPVLGRIEAGIASWYGPKFHGRKTANGEVYDMFALTAAHKTLPFGTVVEVLNRDNGRSVRVRINDRGPFIRGRIIDLSKAAASAIDLIEPGTARVDLFLVAEPARGLFAVQVGAFEDPRRASALAADLSRRFDGVHTVEANGIHRVRLGPFADRNSAHEVLRRLRRQGQEGRLVPAS